MRTKLRYGLTETGSSEFGWLRKQVRGSLRPGLSAFPQAGIDGGRLGRPARSGPCASGHVISGMPWALLINAIHALGAFGAHVCLGDEGAPGSNPTRAAAADRIRPGPRVPPSQSARSHSWWRRRVARDRLGDFSVARVGLDPGCGARPRTPAPDCRDAAGLRRRCSGPV